MGIHGTNSLIMRTRKKIVIEEARLLWKNNQMNPGKKLIKNGSENLH